MAEQKQAPADEKPAVILLHGDDELAIQKAISSMIAKLGEPSMADLNTTHLEGRQASEDDIRSAAYAMPFLTERRLVILHDPLARLTSKGRRDVDSDESASSTVLSVSQRAARERFLALLEAVPETTALVLVISDSRIKRRGEWQWEVLAPNHWLRRWVEKAGKKAWIQDCSLPLVEEMPAWIRKHAEALHGQFSPQAARNLAEYVGNDTRLADQEMLKLLTYVNYKRPVEEEDIALLSVRTNQANVFTLVDAIGERNGHNAAHTLHLLMEENEPSELFGMIVRQFRLLLQVKEVLDEGGGLEQVLSEIKSGGGLHPYVAQKLIAQAEHYSLEKLVAIYRHLLDIDVAIKTSQISPELAFETLIAELAG